MSDNKKYYYLKVKENFYDSEEMIILQNMQDGYLYSDILMKLFLRSLPKNGKLMFKNRIPYTPEILAQVVRHNVGVVERALRIFRDLELVEIIDNGAIFMLDIENYIGHSSSEADRKREYRNRITYEKIRIGQMSDKCPDKNPPELELELELDKDNTVDKSTCLTFDKFYNLYGLKKDRAKAETAYKRISEKERQLIKLTLPKYLESTTTTEISGKGWKPKRKNPTSYLNAKSWLDEYETQEGKNITIELPKKKGASSQEIKENNDKMRNILLGSIKK